MDKDSGRGARPEGTKWNQELTAYKCADEVDVLVPSMAYGENKQS